jgi:tol-pal system beta propeller repeat protein TolB
MMLAAAALAAGLLILIAAGEPLQAAPGDKGKIAFASDRAGNMDIWVMNADGTNPVQLTNDPLPEVFPTFSPDGNKIAFARGERAGAEIHVMNANGTGQTQLTSNAMGDAQPAWSPDGTQIAFLRVEQPTLDREIYVMNANGSGERDLTNDPPPADPADFPPFDIEPAWSPDGTQIAFSSDRSSESPEPCLAVYTMSPNGTDIRKLTADSMEAFSPAWSPEGDKLAFSDHACTGESDLFVMNPDGTGVRQLFETRANETGATWSPDGKKIAFDRFKLTSVGIVPGTGEIYVVGENGKSLQNLTKYPGADDEHPDWSPK